MIFGGSKKAYYSNTPDPVYVTVNDTVNGTVNGTVNVTVNGEVKIDIVHVDGYGDFGDVFYSLFRLTLVDEYDFEVRFITGRFIYVLKRMAGREKKWERNKEWDKENNERNNEEKKQMIGCTIWFLFDECYFFSHRTCWK